MSLSKAELTQVAKEWAAHWYEDFKEYDANHSDLTREDAALQEEVISDQLSQVKEEYALSQTKRSMKTAKSLLSSSQEPDSSQLNYLCQEVSAQTIKILSVFLEKYRSGEPLPESLHPELNISGQPEAAQEAPKHLISEVWEEYRKEKKSSGEWGPERTVDANDYGNRIMKEILGDIHLSTFDKAKARKLKEEILTYPTQREKLKDLKNLSLEEIINKGIEYTPISRQTARNHFNKYNAFLNWAVGNGYLQVNPLKNIPIKVDGDSREKRKVFDKSDLKLIFSSPIFKEHKYTNDYYYWLPLMGLHTGARIEELCQLHLSDIRETEGVHYFNISDEGDDQRLKNKESRRFIPIHKKLIELGFLDYVEARRSQGETLLFSLTQMSERYSHMPSKWFGRYRRSLGIDDKDKAFHSFRHTFITDIYASDAIEHKSKEIVGHSTESTTHKVYKKKNPVPLKSVIDSINWDDVLVNVKPYTAST